MKSGYISPVFLIVTGVFLVALVATLVANTKPLVFSPKAAPLIKEVDLLPSESVDINCASGGKLQIVKSGNSNYKLTCTGFLPSN